MKLATTVDEEVILVMRLTFSRCDHFAHSKRIAKCERLLHKILLFGAARAKRALHAVDVRRP